MNIWIIGGLGILIGIVLGFLLGFGFASFCIRTFIGYAESNPEFMQQFLKVNSDNDFSTNESEYLHNDMTNPFIK